MSAHGWLLACVASHVALYARFMLATNHCLLCGPHRASLGYVNYFVYRCCLKNLRESKIMPCGLPESP
jgi:hypothetical protein